MQRPPSPPAPVLPPREVGGKKTGGGIRYGFVSGDERNYCRTSLGTSRRPCITRTTWIPDAVGM